MNGLVDIEIIDDELDVSDPFGVLFTDVFKKSLCLPVVSFTLVASKYRSNAHLSYDCSES